MRILIIHTFYQLKGGEDTVVFNEMELLRSNGHEVELLQFSNTGSALAKVLQMVFNYSSYKKTGAKIRLFNPDVVHVHNLHYAASPSVLYAIKRYKIPAVVTLHNYRMLCPSATMFFHQKICLTSARHIFPLKAIWKGVYLNSKLLTFWVSFSMAIHYMLKTWKIADGYIVLGKHSQSLFRHSKYKLLAERISVKPNFCYPNLQAKDCQSSYYLYVGRLSEEKGLLTLLDAFSMSKLPLKIAGAGPLQMEVEKYCNRHSNIEFVGSKDKAATAVLMKGAKALLFPSLWYETFGMVVIEAFASGIPVIASRLGQMKNMITDRCNGLHFEAGNAADLNDKLFYFEGLSDPEKLIYGSNAEKTYNEKYTPQNNLKQLITIYDNLIYKKLLSISP